MSAAAVEIVFPQRQHQQMYYLSDEQTQSQSHQVVHDKSKMISSSSTRLSFSILRMPSLVTTKETLTTAIKRERTDRCSVDQQQGKRQKQYHRSVRFAPELEQEIIILPEIQSNLKLNLYYSKRDLTLFAWRERMRTQSIALAGAVNRQQLLRAMNGVPVVPSNRIVVFYRKVLSMSNSLTTDSVKDFVSASFVKESHNTKLEGMQQVEEHRQQHQPNSNNSKTIMGISCRRVIAPCA